MAFAADVDGDGFADLVAIYPTGDCIIDVNLTVEGVKSGGGSQAVTGWGKDCQAAVAGQFDEKPGDDVIGLFSGNTLRLAGSFENGKFKDTAEWATLPSSLKDGALAVIDGKQILAYSKRSGEGFLIDSSSRAPRRVHVPPGMEWIGDAGKSLVGQTRRGEIYWIDKRSYQRLGKLGEERASSTPAAADGMVAYADKIWTSAKTFDLTPDGLPKAPEARAFGDFDNDGDQDLVEFRLGNELHTGNEVLLRRGITAGENDIDHDGLTNDEEKTLGTDPYNPDTDNDGLLDGWEVHGYRGLDLKAMGCDPRHIDLVCLISRFDPVKDDKVKSQIDRVAKTYSELNVPNVDGKNGLNLHVIYLDPIKGDDEKNAWWTNRDKYRPEKWRGVVHWMQITPGGGGQADELGDGGTIGEGALWAVFMHEFGHQMGMNHEGFWSPGLCPIYTSLMNYAYSYSFEDDPNKIHYSDGMLDGYVLRENDLDETIPLPYDKVKFLSQGPYRFRLRPNGKTTLIDWNWNGIFGEKHIRADINYSYATSAGRRDEVGKTETSPWLFVHKGRAYAMYGLAPKPEAPKSDPTLGPDRPGKLVLRRLVKPFQWEPSISLELGGLTGDPVAASYQGRIFAFYPTAGGIVQRVIQDRNVGYEMTEPLVVSESRTATPTVGVYDGKLFLFLTEPDSGQVFYRVAGSDGRLGDPTELDAKSTNPVGMCTDTLTGEAVIGLAQNQDKGRPNRWQIRRYRFESGKLEPTGMEWVDGEKGQSRGTGRLTVLFDGGRDAGPHGRIYLYGRGLTSKETPWACTYVAQQIADKTVHGGWLVKRYYDEWTQSRSAPAAAWFGGDVIWAYRWVDGGGGPTDDNLHVGYRGLGIDPEPMGDHDDLTFFRTFGIRHSLLSLGRP